MSSTFTIYVINNTALEKDWGGRLYDPNETFRIEDVDRLRLCSDPVFYGSYLAGDAIVNDGEYNLPIRVGLGLLQNNEQILQEYYTLVQGDDVLIGNGKILHLHDEKWELEDDFEEEDEE